MTTLTKPFRRVTANEYGYGKWRRRYVVTLIPHEIADQITIKPLGLRKGGFTGTVEGVYQWLARSAANLATLEKARARKTKLAERRATVNRRAQERRFNQSLTS